MESTASRRGWGTSRWIQLRSNPAAVTAIAAAALAAFVWHSWVQGSALGGNNDFDQLWYAARALLRGQNPYAVIQPGTAFAWPLFYPLTAVLSVVPLAWLDVDLGRLAFVALGAGLLGYAIGRHRPHLWPPVPEYAVSSRHPVESVESVPNRCHAGTEPNCCVAGQAESRVGRFRPPGGQSAPDGGRNMCWW
jgi:hypothetical protein